MDPTKDSHKNVPVPEPVPTPEPLAPRPESVPSADLPAWRSARSHAIVWLTAVIGLAVDLVSKYAAFEYLPASRPVVLIPHVLSLDRSLNIGALFGIGRGMTTLFILASVLAMGFVTYMFVTSSRHQRLVHLALGLVLGGAVGNLYDRLFVKVDVVRATSGRQYEGVILQQPRPDQVVIGRYPHGEVAERVRLAPGTAPERHSAVRDFIHVEASFRSRSVWPWIFNVADSMLVVGVGLLLIIYWRHPAGPPRPVAAGQQGTIGQVPSDGGPSGGNGQPRQE